MISILPAEIDVIIHDMQRCIDNKLYYPAILVALTIPDICAAMELPKNVHVRKTHYVSFVDRYTTWRTLGCNGEICYQLRSGLVHRASLARASDVNYTHVIFTIPETKLVLHGLALEHADKVARLINLIDFCESMKNALINWFHENKNKEIVLNNIQHVFRYCPWGLRPFVAGAPVVGSGA